VKTAVAAPADPNRDLLEAMGNMTLDAARRLIESAAIRYGLTWFLFYDTEGVLRSWIGDGDRPFEEGIVS